MFTIPPQHSPDDECVFISPNDPAWDNERLRREKQVLIDSVPAPAADHLARIDEKAWGEAQKRALAQHPSEVWYSGVSRYSLDAEITVPECVRGPDGPATVTISEYLESGVTSFLIRPLGAKARRRVAKLVHGGVEEWSLEVVTEGLVGIRQPSGKHVDLEKTGPKGAKKIADSVLDMLDRVDLALIGEIAQAIHILTYRGGNAEGKP